MTDAGMTPWEFALSRAVREDDAAIFGAGLQLLAEGADPAVTLAAITDLRAKHWRRVLARADRLAAEIESALDATRRPINALLH